MPTLYEVSFSTSPQVLLAALLSLVGNSTQFNPCDKLERQGWHQTHRLLQVRSP